MGTLKRVAELAGVDASTVSRYLSGKRTVRPETEAAILKALHEVQYQPNLVARSLRQGVTRAIAVFIANVHNPLFAEITGDVPAVLERSNYSYMFFPSGDRVEAERSLCQTLIQKRFDGVIMTSRPYDGDPEERHVLDLMARGIRAVFVNRAFGTLPISEIYSDHQAGTFVATSSLLAQGRRRVALLLGHDSPHVDGEIRRRGYQQALQEHDLPLDETLVASAGFSFDEALQKVPRILSLGIDGLICANDLMAVAALKCILAKGARVPDDIALIGYGDTALARMANPELSSVDQHSQELGRRAAEALLALLNEGHGRVIQESLSPNLHIRASSG